MRSLVEHEGWRPSQAAERIRTPGIDLASLARQATATRGVLRRSADRPVRTRPSDPWRMPSWPPPSDSDVDGMERVLDEAFAAQRFELAMDEAVFPALRAVGRAWADGELDVAAEHAASETVRRRLARFFDAARGPMMQARLLVGMPRAGTMSSGSSPSPSRVAGPARRSPTSGRTSRSRAGCGWCARRPCPAIVLGAVTRRGRGGGQPGRRCRRDAGPPAGLFRRRSRAHRRHGDVGRRPAPPVPRRGRGRRRRGHGLRSGPKPR